MLLVGAHKINFRADHLLGRKGSEQMLLLSASLPFLAMRGSYRV
jgi:hypothetical protein